MGVFFRKKSEEEIKQEQPETNAEKKAKRLEELKKEIQGKAKGGLVRFKKQYQMHSGKF
jgi:hypothetical protein